MSHTPSISTPRIHSQTLEEMDPVVLYRLLWLRSIVFNEEQHCTDDDLDGRELEPESRMVWAEIDGEPVATLRILDEAGTAVLGRLVTAREYRGRGLAAALIRRSIKETGDRPVVIHAQAHLKDWYTGFGFVVEGEPFMEAGIAHLPMRLRC